MCGDGIVPTQADLNPGFFVVCFLISKLSLKKKGTSDGW